MGNYFFHTSPIGLRPCQPRPNTLSDASVFEGQLRTDFCYSKNLHKASIIEALAKTYNDHLENIIQHCLSATVGGFTPSDFPEAGLDQVDLDDILFELSE